MQVQVCKIRPVVTPLYNLHLSERRGTMFPCSLGDPFEESDEALDAGVVGTATALLSSATGGSGVEVATAAGGGREDADSLGDRRLSPRDEFISSWCVTGLARLFSSDAAVTMYKVRRLF